jgi:hypothetical protein
MSYKRLNQTLKDIVVDRFHNSTGKRQGVIARLEHLIEEAQIFYSFYGAILARLSTLMVGT